MTVLVEKIESTRREFVNETFHHELTVLRDDGVYRHLRYAAPETGIWSFDVHSL